MDVRLPDGTIIKNVPDGTTQEQLNARLRAAGYEMPQTARERGAAMNQSPAGSIGAGLMNALQGPTFQFGDELFGATQGVRALLTGMPFGQGYREGRDMFRGAVEQYRTDNPIASVAGEAAGGLLVGSPVAKLVGGGAGLAGRIGSAALIGAAEGGIRGAGMANEAENIPGAVAANAALGAAGGAAVKGGTEALGAVGRVVGPRLPQVRGIAEQAIPGMRGINQALDDMPTELAQRRIIDQFARDETTPQRVVRRMEKLGGESRIADGAGENTRNLLDLQATLPGQTANRAENAIVQRQASRGSRLIRSAEQSMQTGGQRYAQTIDSLIDERRAAAAPLYDAVRKTGVMLDDDLVSLLDRAKDAGAFKEAMQIARIAGEDWTVPNGPAAPLAHLDKIKQGLDDLIFANTDKTTGAMNAKAFELNKLRVAFVKKLDELTGGANSIYRQARETYSGYTALKRATEFGGEVWNKKPHDITAKLKDMTESERDAFRIGAFEALREKLGTMSGQTSILRMWREPATREKLQLLFPTKKDWQTFASSVASENRLRKLEAVGRGSQTARRQAAADDQGVRMATDLAQVGGAANSPAGAALALQAITNLYRKVETPEQVRNEIGRILLTKSGADARREIAQLLEMQQRMQRSRAGSAATTGLLGGNLATQTGLGAVQ